jgi:undecaprenyl-diphosphatase
MSTHNGQPEEIAPPPTRRYRARLFQLLLFSAVGAFALLTFLVETRPSFELDLQITLAIQSIDSPLFAGLMRLISWPGFLPQSILIVLLIAFTLYVNGLRWEAAASLLAAAISGASNELAKNLIQRPRPAANEVDVFEVLTSYSFPSGHVMYYTIVFGFVVYLAYTLFKRSVKRSLVLGVCGTFIALVGVSRIYLGQHWASDVLGAYLLGSLILAGIILLYRWGKARFFLHNPDKEW